MNSWIFLLLLPLVSGKLRVCTQTANKAFAGTNNKVHIQLSCSDKTADWILLKHEKRDDFERGEFDCFDLGDTYAEYKQCLNKIGIKMDATFLSTLDVGWALDFVSVCFRDACKKFPFGIRILTSAPHFRELKDAYICTKTSEDAMSGSDGEAFVKVSTSGGESEWIPLLRDGLFLLETTMFDCFSLGNKVDNLQINAANQTTKLGLKLQGSGKLDEWKVQYASFYINGTCEKYFFNEWIIQEDSESSEPC